ncbi:MAG TPA: glutamine-hydrolyzing GMP synthase [Firmicutes bacterium]|nr:glutamine-hydrolyzing GMP synthase [Bacillota bacterium]
MGPVLEPGVEGESSFDTSKFIQSAIQEIRRSVGEEKVVCAVSGGVDSTVAAALLDRAIGERLVSIFVDHGLMRKGEAELIAQIFKQRLRGEFIIVDARDRFLKRLKGVTDPEQKRRAIGDEFIAVFKEQALARSNIGFLAQGTICSDVVESGLGSETAIKSHHNVGGLPEQLGFKLIEPLRELYKDSVRLVGRELGLSEEIINRQPFPGPGLAVRIIGEVTAEKLRLLQEADAIVCQEIERSEYKHKVWQFFAVLPGVNAVGAKSGRRVYGPVVAIRAVVSTDGMTAGWARLPYNLLGSISGRLTGEIPSVARVVYDITPKPPGTIEWE